MFPIANLTLGCKVKNQQPSNIVYIKIKRGFLTKNFDHIFIHLVDDHQFYMVCPFYRLSLAWSTTIMFSA